MKPLLGIETSCDETAAAVVCAGRDVLASVVASQHDLHARYGGVVPEVASRAHMARLLPVLEETFRGAGLGLKEIGGVAVGNRPGLIGSLLVGTSAAKALAWAMGVPLVGVDHVQAHLHAAALDDEPIAGPALGLVASGGHTSLYALASPLTMQLLGRTVDDAVGEAFDKVANILGLGFPGGPAVELLAQKGDPEAVTFPRSLLERDSLSFSFSGLKTAVLYHVRGQPVGRGPGAHFERSVSDLSEGEKADVAAGFQAATVDVLCTKMERAIGRMRDEGNGPRSLVIGGGVSANKLLRTRAAALGEAHGLVVRIPPMKYCLDNAAMIAGLAYHHLEAGETAGLDLEVEATTRK